MDTQQIRSIRERWIYALYVFSHLSYQKQLWIESKFSDSIGDFNKAISQYFDDLDLDNGYDSFINENIVSQQEADIVCDFHKLLVSYIDQIEKRNLSDKNILRDIEWINLTKLALENWNKLKDIITDKTEIFYIASLENKFLT